MAKPHDRGRGHIDGQIDDKSLTIAFCQQRLQERDEVVPPDGFLDERYSPLVEEMAVLVLRIDDGEARLVEIEMTFDKRQHATSDRAEADHDNRTCDRAMHGPLRHWFSPEESRGSRSAVQEGAASFKLAVPANQNVNVVSF